MNYKIEDIQWDPDRVVWAQGKWFWSPYHAYLADNNNVFHLALCDQPVYRSRQGNASCCRTLPQGKICQQCLEWSCLLELRE